MSRGAVDVENLWEIHGKSLGNPTKGILVIWFRWGVCIPIISTVTELVDQGFVCLPWTSYMVAYGHRNISQQNGT